MARIDPEQERKRLVEFYSQQMDGELEKVAKQAYDLTDLAREALTAELANRGFNVEVVEHAPVAPAPPAVPGNPPSPAATAGEILFEDGELELHRLITLRQFRDLPEALLAKGSLESAGIKVVLTDDNIVRLDWFWSNLGGGIKLKVNGEDADAAIEILDQPIPEGFEVAGVGEYQQPYCPSCQSLDVSFKELNRPIAFGSAWIGLPLPVHRRAWRCHTCDVEWEEDGVPGPTGSSP